MDVIIAVGATSDKNKQEQAECYEGTPEAEEDGCGSAFLSARTRVHRAKLREVP